MSPFTTPFAHAAFLGTLLRFMAFALKRGVPIVDFLERFASTEAMPVRCREALRAAALKVRGGTAVSDALAGAPDVFPPWMIAGVKAGERGGHMDSVAENLAELQARRCHFLRLLERDWAYPLFLTGSILLLLAVLGGMMLPDFLDSAGAVARAQPEFQARYPITSALVLRLADTSALAIGVFIALTVVALGAGVRQLMRSSWASTVRDAARQIVARLPFYGRAQRELALAAYCDCVAGLLNQGVVLHEALKLGADSVPDDWLRDVMRESSRRAEAGEPLAEVLASVPVLPHVFVFKLRLGIPEGMLAASFIELADECRVDAEGIIRKSQAYIQPVVILVMGSLVAALWFSVFTVLFAILGILQET